MPRGDCARNLPYNLLYEKGHAGQVFDGDDNHTVLGGAVVAEHNDGTITPIFSTPTVPGFMNLEVTKAYTRLRQPQVSSETSLFLRA